MKKKYITPESRVIIMKTATPLLAGSITEPHGDIHDTIYGFDSSFSDDDVDEGN